MNTRGPERKADDPRPNLPPARSRAQIPGLSRQFQAARAAGIPASQKAGGSKERPSVPARPLRALPRPPHFEPPNRAAVQCRRSAAPCPPDKSPAAGTPPPLPPGNCQAETVPPKGGTIHRAGLSRHRSRRRIRRRHARGSCRPGNRTSLTGSRKLKHDRLVSFGK